MCPICDLYCDFTHLNSSCTYSKITYVFDNWATIFFAGLMSIWATLFLEGWKRYHAEIAYKWNVFDLESEKEIMRPEFQFRVKKKRKNPVTQETEPYVPFFEKCMRFIGSGVSVFFFVSLVVALAIGIIAYRIIIRSIINDSDHGSDSKWLQWKVIILTSITAASINLVFILIMNYFYNWLAYKLTDWECPRTQREFDNSYTLKVFAFQFVNYYSSLFYIAFFKGRFLGVPGIGDLHEVTIKGQRLEQCDPAGCMVELVIQLFIIMVGKQFFNAFMEIGLPICWSIFRQWKLKLPETRKQQRERLRQERLDTIRSQPHGVAQYEHDYALNPVYEQFLFDEYLEMVIQFGFVTLFVAAFPLAPFFALINNIFEIRLDAYKFIVTTQRPMPAQAKGIGIWMKILGIMSNFAVLCNAFVIAFTSDFIPKLYYMYSRGTILGYVDYSLSYYDSRNLTFHRPYMSNITVCRYRDYRKPPCSIQDVLGVMHLKDCDNSHDYSYDFWVILAYRLGFVLLFEHVVLFVKAIFANIIPDVPTKIVLQLQREKYLARQAVLQRQGNILSTRRTSTPTKDEHDLGAAQSKETESEDDDATFEAGKMYDGNDLVPSRQLSQILTRSREHLSPDKAVPKTAPPISKPRFRPKTAQSEPSNLTDLRKSAPPMPSQITERLSDSVESFQTAPPNFDSDVERKDSYEIVAHV
uniref:Anoctamin n=1 Tax=Acrobeloides nanus TaxID=290746 RepID=A0A914DUI3_9BILA